MTAELLPYYEGLGILRRVDGVGSVDEVTERVLASARQLAKSSVRPRRRRRRVLCMSERRERKEPKGDKLEFDGAVKRRCRTRCSA